MIDFRKKVEQAYAAAKPKSGNFWSARELCAVKVPAPAHGDCWGNWTYHADNLTLFYQDPDSPWWYEVDLERDSSWSWIRQFSEKRASLRGGDAKAIGDLAEALLELREHQHLGHRGHSDWPMPERKLATEQIQ